MAPGGHSPGEPSTAQTAGTPLGRRGGRAFRPKRGL